MKDYIVAHLASLFNVP